MDCLEDDDHRVERTVAVMQAGSSRAEERHLADLVDLLARHPAGLRRWSVMRALRAKYERAGREVPHKFEDEIERTFRRHCATNPGEPGQRSDNALFYRPLERAGEVWAVALQRVPEILGAAAR